MIAKEWRSAQWKFLIAAVPVALLLLTLSPYAEFVESARRIPSENAVDMALRDLSDLYYLGGFFVLIPLAAFLGVDVISGEASSGTLLQALSRPVSRYRLLLTKYAVGAATLLVAAAMGKAALIGMAAIRGYPLEHLNVPKAVLSVFVLWMGVLFVLGTAVLASVLFRSVIASIAACAAALLFVLASPSYLFEFIVQDQSYPLSFYGVQLPSDLAINVSLSTYWMPSFYFYREDLFQIAGFPAVNLLVCAISAALPLLAALWVFDKRAY